MTQRSANPIVTNHNYPAGNVTSNKIETFNKWKDFYEKSFTKISWTPENQAELYLFKFSLLQIVF